MIIDVTQSFKIKRRRTLIYRIFLFIFFFFKFLNEKYTKLNYYYYYQQHMVYIFFAVRQAGIYVLERQKLRHTHEI